MKRVKAVDSMPEHVMEEPENLPEQNDFVEDDSDDVFGEEFDVEPPFSLEREREDEESMFPKEHVEPFRGLLFLGSLVDEVEYAGHTFLIRTLTEGEILRVGQLMKAYRGTATENESRKMYTVAACVESVDGESVYKAYEKGHDRIYEKSRVVRNWYPATIDAVYSAYAELETTAMAVSDSLKK